MHLHVQVGVRASYMDGRRLADAEPGLALPHGGAALLVQADTQIVSVRVCIGVRRACVRVCV